MYDYRVLIKAQAAETEWRRKTASRCNSPRPRAARHATLGPAVAFTSSLVILLREGLERSCCWRRRGVPDQD